MELHSNKEVSSVADACEKDSDDDCLTIMCSPIDSDDLNFIPVVTQPTIRTKRREINYNTLKTELATDTECNLNISEPVLKSKESHGKMEPEKQLNNNFKAPRNMGRNRKINTRLSGCQRPKKVSITQKRILKKKLETNSVLQKQVATKGEENKFGSDNDCLPTMCSSSRCWEDLNSTPVAIKKKQGQINRSMNMFARKTKMRVDVKEPIPSSQEVDVDESIPKTPEFYGEKYENMLTSEFEESYLSFDEETNSIQQERKSTSAIRVPPNRNKNTDLNISSTKKSFLNSSAKLSSAVPSAFPDIGSKCANPNSRIEHNRDDRIIDLNCLLNACQNWECRERNIHQIPTDTANVNCKRAEELRSSFIDHLPLIIKLMWGNKIELSFRNNNLLVMQLLKAIKVSLKSDMCHAISLLLRTAMSCFDKHYKMIHHILGNIKHTNIKNILEAVRPLLSIQDFRWPSWLQQRLVTELVDRKTLLSQQDYTALSQVLTSHLFNRLQRTQNLMSVRNPPQKALDQSKSSFVPLGNMNSKSIVQPAIKCRDQNPSNTIIPAQLNSNYHLPVPNSPVASSPSTLELHANNYVLMSKVIMDLILSTAVHSALDILEKFDAKLLYKVAHHLFKQHAAEYVKVVDALMSYFKKRRFMLVLIKNLDTFMSTLTFNLVVKLLKDESKEKAFSLFYAIIESGFEYLYAQVFPESLGEVNSPSPMNNVLIAVDLFIDSDNYDQAAQLFLDNRLLGDASEWKLRPTSEFDIELRDGCIERVFGLFLEDNRPRVTMLACRFFAEMQKQRCPLASNADRVIRLLKKLLSISTFNKLTYDIFKKFYSTADNTSKCTLVINEPSICRAMLVIANSVDPDGWTALLHEIIESGVYPTWQIEGGTIEVHSNWARIETEILLEHFIQRLVSRTELPTSFGLPLSNELGISVVKCAREEAIVTLNVDSSFEAAVKRLQEILFSFRPSVRSVVRNGTLFTMRNDWKNYLHTRKLNQTNEQNSHLIVNRQ